MLEIEKIKAEIALENEKLKAEKRLFRVGCKERQVGQAFVTFRKQTEARQVAKVWGKTNVQLFCSYLYQKLCCFASADPIDSYFIARQAPEPSDVLWENLSVNWYYRQYRRCLTWLITLALISANFYLMIALKQLQRKWFDLKQLAGNSLYHFELIGYTFGLSALIVLSNKVLSVLTRVLTAKEAHHCWTHFYESVAHKLVILMTLNSTGILLAMNPFQDADWFGDTGLVHDVLSLMLTEVLIGLLTSVFSPLHLAKLLKRVFVQRSANKGNLNITQIRANEYFPYRESGKM